MTTRRNFLASLAMGAPLLFLPKIIRPSFRDTLRFGRAELKPVVIITLWNGELVRETVLLPTEDSCPYLIRRFGPNLTNYVSWVRQDYWGSFCELNPEYVALIRDRWDFGKRFEQSAVDLPIIDEF